MGKASRRKKVANPAALAAYRAPIPFVARPFEGLVREVELVAMRELIPAAIMTARTDAAHGGVEFDIVTLLPDGRSAMVRGDGRILIAAQTRANSADLSHDMGAALLAAISAKEDGNEGLIDLDVREPSERLQDLVDPDGFSEMEIVENFAFWLDPSEEVDEQTRRALEENRDEIIETVPVPGVAGMYWCEMNRNFVRYVSAVEENPLFDALSRLHVRGQARLSEGSRFVGAFRACGLAIPVFELAEGETAEGVAAPAAAFVKALDEALAEKGALSAEERRAKQGLVSRQVTIR
ncbi:DUF5926 family protein [Schaalia hyovaginalis]|uniref:DUF5926 domain-containing protein n=1 Tax=Schaalia hyovaginalis TaxID=29316 RepID=A0A923IYC4_9ACTO|nr:DUF5926 family protein [Schaalia hyovaginalis]MBB6333469.1 hypothetical protein [Schaalia hyovaginalis]MDY2668532.1 DUF5926 family protein [Schaalia hyovaginalis]